MNRNFPEIYSATGMMELIQEMATYIVTEDFIYPRDKHNHEYGWGWSLLNTPEDLYGREAC